LSHFWHHAVWAGSAMATARHAGRRAGMQRRVFRTRRPQSWLRLHPAPHAEADREDGGNPNGGGQGLLNGHRSHLSWPSRNDTLSSKALGRPNGSSVVEWQVLHRSFAGFHMGSSCLILASGICVPRAGPGADPENHRLCQCHNELPWTSETGWIGNITHAGQCAGSTRFSTYVY
jgi:hypothetical protein